MPRKPLKQFVKECRAFKVNEVLPFPVAFAHYTDQLKVETKSPPRSNNREQTAFITASGLMFPPPPPDNITPKGPTMPSPTQRKHQEHEQHEQIANTVESLYEAVNNAGGNATNLLEITLKDFIITIAAKNNIRFTHKPSQQAPTTQRIRQASKDLKDLRTKYPDSPTIQNTLQKIENLLDSLTDTPTTPKRETRQNITLTVSDQ